MNNHTTDKNRSENVLVTGGGGFLGSAIVRRLVERGDRVISFSRNRHAGLGSLGVEQISGEIQDKKAVANACRNMDAVYHVAAKPGVWGAYDEFYGINYTGTLNVIDACRSQNVKRLIYTSSPSVVFDGSSMEGVDETVPYPSRHNAAYPETKALAEAAVRNAALGGLSSVILRPHLIWGPGDNHLVPRILARGPKLRIVGDGENIVDTVYIDNAAEAHILADNALKKHPELSGRIYFISQGEPLNLWKMVNDILDTGGQKPVTRKISARKAKAAGMILEMLYKLFHISSEPPMTRFVAEELATSHWFDISAARRDLGYNPRITTQEGLKRLKTWLATQHSKGVQ